MTSEAIHRRCVRRPHPLKTGLGIESCDAGLEAPHPFFCEHQPLAHHTRGFNYPGHSYSLFQTQPSPIQGIQRRTKSHPRCTQDTSKKHPRDMQGAPDAKLRRKTGHLDSHTRAFKYPSHNHRDATKPRPRLIQGTTRLPPRRTQDTSKRHARST